MPAVTRELSITYAGVTVGGTSSVYLLHGEPPYRIFGDYRHVTVECSVICRDATENAFNTTSAALEVAFSKPNQDLTITLGAATLETFSHGSNTGMLGEPKFEKPGSPFDTARSKLYRLSVTFNRPFSLAGKNGLDSAQIEVGVTASGVHTIRVSGTYSALSSNTAVQQYASAINGLIGAAETLLGGTYERGRLSYNYDDQNKVLKFESTSVELIYNQAQGVLNHAAIRNQLLTVSRTTLAPGDFAGALRPLELTIAYSADIDKTQTQGLVALWDSTIKPWLIQNARDVAAASAIAVTRLAPVFDFPANRIAAQMEVMAITGSSTWGRVIRTRTEENFGVQLVPVWSGKPFGRERFDVPQMRRFTVTDTLIRLGAVLTGAGSGGGSGGGDGGSQDIINVGGNNQPGGSIGAGSLGFFGSFGGSGTPFSNFGFGGGNQLGGSILAGQPGGGAVPSGGGGAAQAGIKAPDGFILISRVKESSPSIVGTTDASFSVTSETITETYEYAEIVSPGTGGDGRVESGTGPNAGIGGTYLPGYGP